MKKSIAVLALLAAVSGQAADSAVYSANIVGFTKMSLEKGSRTIVGIPFNNGADQVASDVFGADLPVGSKIYVKPKGEAYAIEEYSVTVGAPPTFTATTNWNPNTTSLTAGMGFWVEIPDDAQEESYDVVLSGNVASESDLVAISEGVNLISYPYPVSMTWTNTALAQAATVGDKLYSWNGAGYEINEYSVTVGPPPTFTSTTNWSNPSLILDISKGFWYTTDDSTIVGVEEPLPYQL
jgi:hypothetical protein